MPPYLALQWEECQSSDQAHDAHEPGPLRSSLWVICTTALTVTHKERLPVTHKTSPKRLGSQELGGSCLSRLTCGPRGIALKALTIRKVLHLTAWWPSPCSSSLSSVTISALWASTAWLVKGSLALEVGLCRDLPKLQAARAQEVPKHPPLLGTMVTVLYY